MDKVNLYDNQTTATINEASSDSKSNSLNSDIIDSQVKPDRTYSSRRSFTCSYKLQILTAYNVCANSKERGELLRREGLYHSRISAWKSQQAAGKFAKSKKTKSTVRTEHLAQENKELKNKLAQAEAIIDIQKKVSDLFGMHIHPLDTSEVNS